MSDSGVEQMREVTKAYANWAVGLDARWSGTGGAVDESFPEALGLQWSFFVIYVFLGGADEINFQDVMEQLVPANFSSFAHSVTAYDDAWSLANAWPNTPPYSPAPILDASFNVIESSLIDKAAMKDRFPEHIVSTYLEKGFASSFSHDLPGDTAELADATSISQAFREAALLVEYPGSESLSPNAYFSESSYDMPGTSWRERYWGEGKYQKLLSVKNKYDPQGLLWCHHCVGSEDEDEGAADRRRLADFLV
jgi:ribonuclease T2